MQDKKKIQAGIIYFIPIYPNQNLLFWRDPKSKYRLRKKSKKENIYFIPIFPNQVLLFWKDPKNKSRVRKKSRKELVFSSLSIQIKFYFFGEIQKANTK